MQEFSVNHAGVLCLYATPSSLDSVLLSLQYCPVHPARSFQNHLVWVVTLFTPSNLFPILKMHFLIPEEIAFRIANIQHGTVIHSLAVLANISNVLVKSGAIFSYTFCHVFKVPEKHINYSAVFHINLQRHPLSNLC